MRKRQLNASLMAGLILTGCAMTVAFLSVFWLPHSPNMPNIPERMLPAGSPGHWLGTDKLGRDIVAQLMVGARTSMIVGAGGAGISLILGAILGLTAASGGRTTDEAISRLADIMLSIPGMVTALVLAATIGSGMLTTIFALTAFFTPSFTRVARAAAMSVLQEDFVTAASLYGRGRVFILARHVLPNIAGVLIVQFTLYFAAGILTEAGLSYLGVGMSSQGIAWGLLLN
ncbi:MAG: ABC transporter permease, partial [Rhodobacteraceae bacterium]|nr:ABC transporter permease [Paracoccaceae bacterium]